MQELAIPNFLHRPPAYRDIYDQFAIDSSFLWLLRSIAVNQPNYDVSGMFVLEGRIDAQLNGLMSSVEMGWSACLEGLELQEVGEVFTAMVIAMRSHDVQKVQRAVEVGLKSEDCIAGLVSAMGWVNNEIATSWTQRFLNGKLMSHKYLGIASCSILRQDPGDLLTEILHREECQQDEKLYARSLRLVGELRRQDCMPALLLATQHETESIRFWASWSAALLGQRTVVTLLKPFVFNAQSPYQLLAVQLCFRILKIDVARQWISELAKDENNIRLVIKATGILGDVHAVNWLITKMDDLKFSKVAAEAFTFITGIDLVKHELTFEPPVTHPMHPNDDSTDENVDLDEDENLVFPNFKKITTLWRIDGKKFIIGKRYFLGQPISTQWLTSIIQNGSQRQRHAAALELALTDNNFQFPNTKSRIAVL